MDIEEEAQKFRRHVQHLTKQWQRRFSPPAMEWFSNFFTPLLADVASPDEIEAKKLLLRDLHALLVQAQAEVVWKKRNKKGKNAKSLPEDGPAELVIEKTPLQKLEEVELRAFGSSVMGVSGRGGDLDISLEGVISRQSGGRRVSSVKNTKFQKELLKDVHSALRKRGVFKQGVLVLNAHVPVSKFLVAANGIRCDLSIGNTIGVLKSRLVGQVLQADMRVRSLVILTKRWAKAHKINDSPCGTFSSYCLTLAVISFCQDRQPAIVPPFRDLFAGLREEIRKMTKEKMSSSLISLLDKYQGRVAHWAEEIACNGSRNKETLFELFLGFLTALRLQVMETSQMCSDSDGKLTSSAWEGGFVALPWKRQHLQHHLFIEDPFEGVASNPARSLQVEGFRRIKNVLNFSNNAISRFTKGKRHEAQNVEELLAALFCWKNSISTHFGPPVIPHFPIPPPPAYPKPLDAPPTIHNFPEKVLEPHLGVNPVTIGSFNPPFQCPPIVFGTFNPSILPWTPPLRGHHNSF